MLVRRQDGGVNLIRKAPEVDTLVLPGGGAKGVVYVALMRIMKEYGAFAGVRHLVGSSAGALAATLMAFIDDDAAMQSMLASELPTLLDTQDGLHSTYPDLAFHNTMSAGAQAIWRLKGGKPLGEANGLVQKIDEITAAATKNYLDALDDGERDRKISAYAHARGLDTPAVAALRTRLDMLCKAPDFKHSRRGSMITFRDAEMLHHFAPDRFRTVASTAYAPETGDIHYFDAESTPDMPLAYATRASLSHPLLATGVRIGDGPTLIDGGLRSNIPSETVYGHDMARAIGEPGSREDEARRARTMVGLFGNGPKAAPAPSRQTNVVMRLLSSAWSFVSSIPRRFSNWFMNQFLHRVSLNPRLDADRAMDHRKFDAAGANGLRLHHGTLRTTDLNVSARRQEEAIDDALTGLREQLRQREDQAWFVTAASVKDTHAMLTDEEKARILEEGPPAPPDQSASTTAWEAYDAAKPAFLQASASGDEDAARQAEEQLVQAERRMYRLSNDYRHAHDRYKLATELYAMVAAEQNAGTVSSGAEPSAA